MILKLFRLAVQWSDIFVFNMTYIQLWAYHAFAHKYSVVSNLCLAGSSLDPALNIFMIAETIAKVL